MVVLHANWTGGALHVWGESADLLSRAGDASSGDGGAEAACPHPFSMDADGVRREMERLGCDTSACESGVLSVRLPGMGGVPIPSPALAHAVGHSASPEQGEAALGLGSYRVASVAVDPGEVPAVLERMDRLEIEPDAERSRRIHTGPGVEYFCVAAQLARHLLAQQRVVPMLTQSADGALRGAWRPWPGDLGTAERVTDLLRAMPPAARASEDEFGHESWPILEDFLNRITDASCRRTLVSERMEETIESIRPASDPHVAWLSGLLGSGCEIMGGDSLAMSRTVRRWIGSLDERGASSAWRLTFRLREPAEAPEDEGLAAWELDFLLESTEAPGVAIEAADVWVLPGDAITIEGYRLDAPADLLLGELARAARLYPRLEDSLAGSDPTALRLDTGSAYTFLSEIRPILIEQGFGVMAPAWWGSPDSRLGARLVLGGEPPTVGNATGADPHAGPAQFGLDTLVNYHWQIAIGKTTLTLREFEELAARRSPLVRIGDGWVEVRPEDVRAAVAFIHTNPGGEMRLGEAVRLAFAADGSETGVPVVGVQAEGWIDNLLGETGEGPPQIEPSARFHGTLRPYQLRGLSWLVFLERYGLGACLADDMGLGKTIQLLALLVYERESQRPGPTLLVVPTSVVGNWVHEARRFAPDLRVIVHHGPDRPQDERFVDGARSADAVVTTYSLAHRDRDLLCSVAWHRIVLDEAQFIKNASSKQAKSVRQIPARHRVALTGTPVENRLSELWSIMEFLNPGHLSTPRDFRKRFAVPIERNHDARRRQRLRQLVQPFILRRLKTDPTVISDLPEKVESREYCHLSPEQARLYEANVKRMLDAVDSAEGIRRRGLVLATLVRLKQICNHPAQLLGEESGPDSSEPPDPNRSGKCIRLIEMLDEVIAAGDSALVFTQFRRMGVILAHILRHELDHETLLLHGGTPRIQRQRIVEAFQDPRSATPVMVISLKAGGVGLNLTAANHVFHFDRWWNPAVENQATDRAFRIGQTRRVQVHKFVVRGTLEERIDEMLQRKAELAQQIIGSGEKWLTDLDTSQLRDVLTLRRDAVGESD